MAVTRLMTEIQKKAVKLGMQYAMLAEQVKGMNISGPEDLRVELHDMIRKTEIEKKAKNTIMLLEKMETIMKTNIQASA